MPTIDIYAVTGTFADIDKLAKDAAAFVHEMAPGVITNVDGDGNCVRVQVLTNDRLRSRTVRYRSRRLVLNRVPPPPSRLQPQRGMGPVGVLHQNC